MASTSGIDRSAKQPRLAYNRGADTDRGEDAGEPLQDEELEEEECGIGSESDAEGGDLPDGAAEDAEGGDLPDDAAKDAGGGDEPGAAAEDLAPDAVRPKLEASDYGANSPTSKGSRRLSLDLRGVWFYVRRIKSKVYREVLGPKPKTAGAARKVVSGHTHVCVLCWRRMVVTQDWNRNGAFITTVPNALIRKYHPNIDVGKASQDRFDASGQRKTVALLSAGSSSTGSAIICSSSAGSNSASSSSADSRLDGAPAPSSAGLATYFASPAIGPSPPPRAPTYTAEGTSLRRPSTIPSSAECSSRTT